MDNPTNEYLRDAVMTATPEQLQLMLYDGAIRFTRQGIEGIRQKKWEDAFSGFNRAQKIILELINALNYDVDRQLCTKMAGLYQFIYRKVVEAGVDRDPAAAEEALGQLEYQRETWVLLMERLRQERAGQASAPSPGNNPAAQPQSEHGTLCLEC